MANNYDCNISSPNGLRQSHALAMIMTRVNVDAAEDNDDETFPRLKRNVVKDKELKDPPMKDRRSFLC